MRIPTTVVAFVIALFAVVALPAAALTPTPTPAGQLSDVAYQPAYEITRPDGSFIPPAERVVTAAVSWRSNATTGDFQVFSRRAEGAAGELRGTVSAASGAAGAFTFKETWTFFDHPLCYIVRYGGAEAESCRPTPPTSGGSATPPPAGTPWPAPVGLRMVNGYSDGLAVTFVDFSWAVLTGFTGVFEVQRAKTTERFRPLESQFVTIGTVAASEAVAGRGTFKDEVDLVTMYYTPPCYRVRTVINGETGPYSTEISCAVLPTDVPPPGGPLPPAVGTNEARSSGAPASAFLSMGLIAAGAGLGVLWAVRRRTA